MRLKAIRNAVDLDQNAPNVHSLRFSNVRSGWEQWILLTGDRHHDNPDSDNELERQHLDMAIDRDALIFDVGDLHDAMQGTGDKRASKDKLKGELAQVAYFDAMLNVEAKFYRPYADRWVLMALGNHDTAVMKYYGTNLVDRLAEKMRAEPGGITVAGGYGGWIHFKFEIQRTAQMSLKMKYFHGGGGDSVMSFGTLDVRRQAAYLPDANIVVNGHDHNGYVIPLRRERLTESGTVTQDTTWFLRTMTYKDEYKDGSGGYQVEHKAPPKPVGCIWGRLFYDDKRVRCEFTQDVK